MIVSFRKETVTTRQIPKPLSRPIRSRGSGGSLPCWCAAYDVTFVNEGESEACLELKVIRRRREEASAVAFKGGGFFVFKRKRLFRVFVPGQPRAVTMVANGPLYRNRFQISLPFNVGLETGQERGFFKLNPGVEFEVRRSNLLLQGCVRTLSYSDGSGCFGRMTSNRFASVDFRNDDLIAAHFGNRTTFSLATGLLLWTNRNSFQDL